MSRSSSSNDESDPDHDLFIAIQGTRNDPAAVRQALRDGADVNSMWQSDAHNITPLVVACENGNAEIVRILLDAGADALFQNWRRCTALHEACIHGHLSTVEMLINHDNNLLEIADDHAQTPLFVAIKFGRSEISQFLLDRGANVSVTDRDRSTTLIMACQGENLEIVRRLLAAGVDVEARDGSKQTALHLAALFGRVEVVRELILRHNADMFAVNEDRSTPFDMACRRHPQLTLHALFEMFANKSTQEHGHLALHAILDAAQYSYAVNRIYDFHPPLNPLRIRLRLGKLTLQNLHTLMQHFDTELIRHRDDSGKLPIHIACRNHAPVEVLSMLVEMDPTTLQIAEYSSALPIHLLCDSSSAGAPTEYASVRYLVEQGGVGTLAARNHQGALPLHVLCGSTRPSWRTVRYLIQSFPGSVSARTNAGQYPFMIAADKESSASLSVVYELVRANPGLMIRNNE